MAVNIPFLFAAPGRISRGAVVACLLLSACATAPQPSGINDPSERFNRSVHGFNKGLDRAVVRPGSEVYGAIVPEPLRQSVSNVADTLDQPGDFVNNLLQGKVEDAGANFARMAVNVVFGLGGLLDVATDAGIPRAKTDFGETLHVWGVGEGSYVERPLAGPSTQRDAFGALVDLVLNPVGQVANGKDATAVAVITVLSKLGDRKRYSNTVDSILYDSADSYAQARLLYLQNRRFELGQTSDTDADGGDGFIDPYEDPYAQ